MDHQLHFQCLHILHCSWLVIGLISFVVRYPKLKNMNNDELSRLILNQSEREVKEMIQDKNNMT